MKNNYLLVLAFLFGIVSVNAQSSYVDGVFILNEGQFGNNTASVSFLDGMGTLSNDIFATENAGMDIGQIAQGMGFQGDYVYIVSNGSNEVNVIDRNAFIHVTTITVGLNNPRYIAFDNGLGYITNWGDPFDTTDDYIAVLDLATNTIDPDNNILVVEGPEEIIKSGNQLFVAHQGGFGSGNTVSVIDLTDSSVSSINVGDRPNSLQVDDTYLYVLCGGEPAWTGAETAGTLYRIALSDFSAVDTYNFATIEHPEFLEINNGEAYYVLNNNIYQFDFTGSLPATEFINTAPESIAIAYGMDLIDDVFYLADAVDYVSNGKVASYDIAGTHLETYTVGLIPNAIYKNEEPLLVGPYAPPADQAGTTAIETASGLFVDWASGVTITRGLQDISNPGGDFASFGESSAATGAADNTVVSLGDAGEAVLTFDTPIANGDGYDFAIFENSFSDTFLELAFVEVSSDGVNYFRFSAHSLTQTETQVDGFGNIDATFVNNLAGKYRANFGTPFDLSDLGDDPLLDKDQITHVKIIDVIGTIDPTFATYDAYGNAVNDPYPTPFASSGFDLDGVGVINQSDLSISEVSSERNIVMYPNPATNHFSIQGYLQNIDVEIYSQTGRLLKSLKGISGNQIDISSFADGMYVVKVIGNNKGSLFKLIKR
ncbi:DUF5074 domain-containing protein [Winogradskyella sp.]|uniref:DUF5074 domain-containing protein n=1 Tax=Winogradskyella sp. TaxID=1883156 RepID=UPI00260EBD2B|nr:DUF5074 domain-containing protein [Winogradskyella sp.]